MPETVRHYILGGAFAAPDGTVSDAGPFFWIPSFAKIGNQNYVAAGNASDLSETDPNALLTPSWAIDAMPTDWTGLSNARVASVWIVPDTSIQSLSGHPQNDVDTLLALIDEIQKAVPGTPVAIYEDWAAIDPFLMNDVLIEPVRKVYFDYVTEDHHTWHLQLVTLLQDARPDVEISLVPMASTLAELALSGEVPGLDAVLMPEDTVTGGEARAFLAAAHGYVTAFETPLPDDASMPDTLDPVVTSGFPILANFITTAVLGDMPAPSPQPDPLPDPDPGPVTVTGTTGNDSVELSGNETRVDLGAGLDTIVVNATRADTSITFDPDGNLLLGEVDPITLSNVERLSLQDGTLAFDTDDVAGQAYRLYQACFNRTPDGEGLGFWIKQIDAGNVTLREAAAHFMASEEFTTAYGAQEEVTDVLFLTLLYVNALGRTPDDSGFIFWREQQEQGVTRADMMISFSESVENTAQVAPVIDDGIWYI